MPRVGGAQKVCIILFSRRGVVVSEAPHCVYKFIKPLLRLNVEGNGREELALYQVHKFPTKNRTEDAGGGAAEH